MKRSLLALVLGMTVVGSALAAGPARQQVNQQKRIAQGVRSGSLTPMEARRLEAQERQLHRTIIRDRRDGVGLTPRERVQIDRRQDQLSRRIYIQKHNGQTR